jgi:hypothetical protein
MTPSGSSLPQARRVSGHAAFAQRFPHRATLPLHPRIERGRGRRAARAADARLSHRRCRHRRRTPRQARRGRQRSRARRRHPARRAPCRHPRQSALGREGDNFPHRQVRRRSGLGASRAAQRPGGVRARAHGVGRKERHATRSGSGVEPERSARHSGTRARRGAQPRRPWRRPNSHCRPDGLCSQLILGGPKS